MNWRRGLLLAGINLIAAIPMVSILAARDAQIRREWKQQSILDGTPRVSGVASAFGMQPKIVRVQEEQTVNFNPCELWGRTPPQAAVVQTGNLPVFVISQWRVECPSKWSIARMLGVSDAGLLSYANFEATRRVDVALCVLIAVQWSLIGSFPLARARRWWAEPGACITTCTAIGSAIALRGCPP
jgi:hypothetical protein